jgi:hypothetical protein
LAGPSEMFSKMIGAVAADMDQRHAHRVFAQRGHVERHAQRFLEALAVRQHRAGVLWIEPRVGRRGALAEIATHDEYAVEALHLEAHLELDVAFLVTLLRGLAGLEDAAHRLQRMSRDAFGPYRIDGAARQAGLVGVEAANRPAADAGKDDAVPAHDEGEIRQ